MQLIIHLIDSAVEEEIVINNYTLLTYYTQSQRVITDDLTGFELSDHTTYTFKGDTQVSLNGYNISYIELSYS